MRELIKEIWSTSKRNKLRTSLTGFAVAWGIFMLIFLLGAGNGLINAQLQQSTRFLANSMRVFPGETSKAYKGLKEGRSITLNDKDILISNKAITLGDVSGKTCLLIDDMIDTAGTITQGAKALVEVGGAKEVYVCCTHAVLSGPAIERLENSVIKKVYMLNTIELTEDKKISKIEEITVAPLFARAIESIFAELPLSRLYE